MVNRFPFSSMPNGQIVFSLSVLVHLSFSLVLHSLFLAIDVCATRWLIQLRLTMAFRLLFLFFSNTTWNAKTARTSHTHHRPSLPHQSSNFLRFDGYAFPPFGWHSQHMIIIGVKKKQNQITINGILRFSVSVVFVRNFVSLALDTLALSHTSLWLRVRCVLSLSLSHV